MGVTKYEYHGGGISVGTTASIGGHCSELTALEELVLMDAQVIAEREGESRFSVALFHRNLQVFVLRYGGRETKALQLFS